MNLVNQKLKAWSFQQRKNYFCMLNIERPRTRQFDYLFLLLSDTPCIISHFIDFI